MDGVRSVNADFLALEPASLGTAEGSFDHVISFMCIMHMAQASRGAVFRQAARYLKPGGRLYVEDLFQRGRFNAEEWRDLDEIVACPFLPTREGYVADVGAGGFVEVEFEDVTEEWKSFVVARAVEYRGRERGERNEGLERFYDTMAGVFEGGNLGGMRLTAVKG